MKKNVVLIMGIGKMEQIGVSTLWRDKARRLSALQFARQLRRSRSGVQARVKFVIARRKTQLMC